MIKPVTFLYSVRLDISSSKDALAVETALILLWSRTLLPYHHLCAVEVLSIQGSFQYVYVVTGTVDHLLFGGFYRCFRWTAHT